MNKILIYRKRVMPLNTGFKNLEVSTIGKTDSLYSMWARLGVNFPSFEPSIEEPLLEDLIAKTSLIGRYEPRLIEAMSGWIQKHGDLLNSSLMHKYINHGDSAVIGLISDLLDSKESTKFKSIQKYCKPKVKAEMLFYSAESSSTMKAQAIENATEFNDRWNLYYVSLRIKTDTVYNRKEVLKKNPNLARRALFGSEMRTEILNFLLSKNVSFPSEIAKALGYRYHRVLEDVHNLLRDGALVERSFNKKKEIRLSQPFIDYLKTIPF